MRPWILLVWLLAAMSCAQAAQEQGIRLNLRDVDIRTVIDSVADMTHKNFVVDPRVQGKVTVMSAVDMSREELYRTFLSILQVHGYAAVPTGSVIKILPDDNARQLGQARPDDPADGKAADALVTQVMQLKHVSAAQLVPVLRPLVPQDGHLAGYPDSNVLIVTDRESNIRRLAQIVARVDRPTGDEIEVMRLNHADANEVVSVLNQLQRQGQNAPDKSPLLAADERSNSVLLSGDAAERIRLRGLIAHLDIPLERSGNTNVVFLRYANARLLAELLSDRAIVSQGKRRRPQDSAVAIRADEQNNALVITASPQEFRNLQQVIRQLDIRRAQVMVEAVIAEVSTDLSREIGVQLAVGRLNGANSSPVAATNLGGVPLTGILQSVAGLVAGTATDPVDLPGGLNLAASDFSNGDFSWAVLLNALAGDGATNILSTPVLLATDNEEAEIVVGQNVPFVTGQFTSTSTGGTTTSVSNPFQTIERRDVGITLKVKPQINEGSSVRLSIAQEVSSLATSSVSASDLVTNKRSITTTISVEDGQVVVLGGLIEDRYRDSQQKVPLLGDIPVLGKLFQYNQSSKTKQNLMVFLRPVILRNPQLASYYSGRKYSFLREQQLQAKLQQRAGAQAVPAAAFPRDLQQLFDRSGEDKPVGPSAGAAHADRKAQANTYFDVMENL